MSRLVAWVRLHRRSLVTLGVAAVVAAFAFPVWIVDVGTGLDYSWAAGLHLARHDDLAFGRDIVFTYGPLGFLVGPAMFFHSSGTMAVVVRIPLMLVSSWFVVSRLRSSFGLAISGLLALPLLWISTSYFAIGGEAPVTLLALFGAALLGLLVRQERPQPRRWIAPCCGAVAALFLLVKFDTGIEALVLAAFALATAAARPPAATPERHESGSTPGPRVWLAPIGRVVLGFVVTVPVLWLVAGQSLAQLPRWLSRSWDIIVNNNDAMVADFGQPWHRTMGAVLVGALLILLVPRLRQVPSRHAALTVMFVAGLLFIFVKQAYNRHDNGHVLLLCSAAVFIAVTLVERSTRSAFLGAVALLTVAAMALVGGRDTIPFFRPSDSLRTLKRTAVLAVDRGARQAVIDWGHTAIPRAFPVPPLMVARMEGQTVHIEPVEAVVAWTYPKIRWRPLPAFQSYVAYSPSLDRLNARFLRSRRAPRFVLLESSAIDGRIPRWESPEAQVEIICNYAIVETSDRWQLFERRAKRACGAPQPIAAPSRVRRGEPVSTPAAGPGDLVVARFDGLEPGFTSKVWSFVVRPSKLYVTLDADPNAHRVVAATAGQPHLVALPECLRDRLGAYDSRTYASLTISSGPTPKRGGHYTVQYERMPYAC